MNRYSANIKIIMDAIHKASRALVRDFGEVENLQVSRKGPGDFVTESDLRVEKLLVTELGRARPSYSFLVEESGVIDAIEPESSDEHFRFLIDPIDGTTNFMHGYSFFCISVAIERKFAGKSEIVAAVISNPITRELFWAEKGKGAWLETERGSVRIRVANRVKIEDALMVNCSFRHHSFEKSESFKQLTSDVAAVRNTGSVALSLAYLASGRFDVLFQEGAKAWDIAAGILLVKEAGGHVTDATGSTDVDQILFGNSLLVANHELHNNVSKKLNSK